MKLLGSHHNIVSLVGCCTLQEHKFPVIEYVPFGDLLQWLRRRRPSINRNQGTDGYEEKKYYEEKEIFNAQKELSECDQDLKNVNGVIGVNYGVMWPLTFTDTRITWWVNIFFFAIQEKEDDTQDGIDQDQPLQEQTLLMMESTSSRDNRDIILDVTLFSENPAEENSDDVLAQENFELMPIPSTSQENSNAGAILVSTENIDDVDDDEDDFLYQENIELMPMAPTSKENSNAAAILISSESIDDDDIKEDGFPDQEGMELLPMPSTSQGNSNALTILKSSENNDDDDDEEEADSLTTQKLFSFARQIAKGMNHLAEKGFIHRDLAARNILVGSDNRVKVKPSLSHQPKVKDFGLMRQIYEDVYSGKNTKKLPVKWMTPESINDSIYTIKSDVWSFGIILWEMATMGGVPYPTLTNRELCGLLKTGYRMERPDMCSSTRVSIIDQFCSAMQLLNVLSSSYRYELMSECWNEDPSSRPSFSELIDRLEVMMTRNVPYCDLDRHDESRPYYNLPVNAQRIRK
ncbi:tyrosine-protein kinase receptor torso-like [Orbicella faveolata]|uniref:tyrosine-protein kinase receptor torso-like n=1 Tax=Orbicella faveolata TaxID=48498 RepID=UPI0009E629CC|nr:tyrosine-protein kinase receptor torso-like [Orbicella faveolata]